MEFSVTIIRNAKSYTYVFLLYPKSIQWDPVYLDPKDPEAQSTKQHWVSTCDYKTRPFTYVAEEGFGIDIAHTAIYPAE